MAVQHWLISAALTSEEAKQPASEFSPTGDVVDKWKSVAKETRLTLEQLAGAVAGYLELPRADFAKLEVEFAKQLPENVARMHLVVPIIAEGHDALVATADPADMSTLDELSFTLGMPIKACVGSPEEIEAALTRVYGQEDDQLQGWGDVPSSLLAANLTMRRPDGSAIQTGQSATSKLFIELMKRSVNLNASDMHVQPYGDGAVVRNRVDGVLYRAVNLPASVHEHLIRHVKAISGMDLTKQMIPQDGELRMELEHNEIDLRLSVIPVSGSERLVARLLPQNQVRALSMLRLPERELATLKRLSENADGMILMTGPTGSGKTSVLYAMLAEKNRPDINIMTVEEPVEYRLRGASQINVAPRTGLTFARALRSILRQDPDVVMVGEIRDEETAEIAAQAAMTGHFVLSTVHTLDALLATVRLSDLGVSTATLADALQAVASQRLVRTFCTACKEPLEEKDYSANDLRFAEIWTSPAWKAKGCDACRGTGMSGRVPVIEIVEIRDELRKLLRSGQTELEVLESLAMSSGTRFLAEGFAHRVAEGSTSVAEIVRVYGTGFFGRLQRYANMRKALGDLPVSEE
jgi:type II secretory ATPase GspE/PulE/Tfp pilus assembly ATPase PilB-like protein